MLEKITPNDTFLCKVPFYRFFVEKAPKNFDFLKKYVIMII